MFHMQALEEGKPPPDAPESLLKRLSPAGRAKLLQVVARQRRRQATTPPDSPGGSDTFSEAASDKLALPIVPGYKLLAESGRGGMAVVYKARDLRLNRTVALKIILAGNFADADRLARFRAEAVMVARLEHPNVVKIHEVGEHGGLPYLALELVEGGTLQDKLAAGHRSPREAAQIVQTLALAVHHAHEQGIIHRDLKPANVLLSKSGVLKITDFGLAKKVDQKGKTVSGTIIGTPEYMAPEQAGGRVREVGPASDVYALGIILYEVLTGAPPFHEAALLDTLLKVLTEDPEPPSKTRPRLPPDLETICLKCLQKKVSARYATAEALAEELGRFLANEPILARPWPWWRRSVHWVRRRPRLTATAAILLILALAAGGSWWWNHSSRELARSAIATARESARRTFDQLDEQTLLGLQAADKLLALHKELKGLATVYEKFHRDDPSVATIQEELADIYIRLGWLVALHQDRSEAISWINKGQVLLAELAAAHPGTKTYLEKLANAHGDLWLLYSLQNLPEQAAAAYQEAIHADENLISSFGGDASSFARLAQDWAELAGSRHNRGDLTEAEAAFAKAIAAQQKAMEAAPADYQQAFQQVGILHGRGEILAALGQMEKAEETFAQALKLQDRFLDPESPDFIVLAAAQKLEWDKAIGGVPGPQTSLSALLRRNQRKRNINKAVAFYTRLLSNRPDDLVCKRQLARNLSLEAMQATAARDPDADETARRAVKLYDELRAAKPKDKAYALETAQLCVNFGLMLLGRGQFQDLGRWCDPAEHALGAADDRDSQKPGVKILRRDFYSLRAALRNSQERYVDSLRDFQSALALDPSEQGVIANAYATAVAAARLRVITLLRGGLYDQAVAETEALAEIPAIPGEALYDGACVFAVAAGAAKDGQVRERHAARSVELLRRAFAAGFGKDPVQKMSGILDDPVQHMEQDPDLVGVRNRKDYRALLADLKRKP
jgi:serine/threonine protein kinase